MSASLATVPLEVLATICSHLTAKDILERLFGIGNDLLTYKLRHGGVVDLYFVLSELSGGTISNKHIVACQSLSLRTFKYYGSQDPLANRLVLGLKPTLRHLFGRLPDLIERLPLPESNRVFPSSHADGGVWNVRTTFPMLETLQLDFVNQDTLLTDPISAARFFGGLPPALTSLSVPPFLSVNFWPLHPPSMTLVYGATDNFPPSLDVAPNLTSLQSLQMRWDVSQAFWGPRPHAPDLCSAWSTIDDVTEAHLPPQLTSLEMEGPSHLLALPTTLTSLTYRHIRYLTGFDIFTLLKMLPPSMTCLDVDGCMIKSIESNLPVLRHMERFRLTCGVSDISLSSSVAVAFLDCLPNLEALTLKIHVNQGRGSLATEQQTGLDVQHLSRLNTRTIRSLEAAFKPSCFVAAGDGTYPLEPLLKLHTLSIMTQPSDNFTFAAIPSSVTSLSLVRGLFSSKTLHLLPASVTDLRGGLQVRPEEYSEPCLPRPSNSPSSGYKDSPHFPVEHSFDQTVFGSCIRRFKRDDSKVSNGIAIEFTGSQVGTLQLYSTIPLLAPSLTSVKLGDIETIDWTAESSRT